MKDTLKIDKNTNINIETPDTCPHCQKGIKPVVTTFFDDDYFNQAFLYVVFKCPVCQQIFFAKYYLETWGSFTTLNLRDYSLHPSEIIGGHGLVKEFSNEIKELSPEFVTLYNDAYKAEQYGLKTIIGISYRLAFEHLIKDYCIKTHDDKKEEILKKSLSQCINEYLDEEIKDITKRGAWLGNDYAHYESKHPDMNINDLKSVIDICVSKIEFKIKETNYIKNIKKK